MRRTSLTNQQAQILADLLRERREDLGRSMRSVCLDAGCNIATLSFLEAGTNRGPQPDTLKAIARALQLPVSDVFVAIGWLPTDELPTLQPYLRRKYEGLSDDDIDAIGAYTERLRRRHGAARPDDHEDELP